MCHKDFVDVLLVKTLLKLLIGNLTYAHQHYLKPLCRHLSCFKGSKGNRSHLCAGYIIIFKHLEEGINSVFERKHYGHSIIHYEENHSKGFQI